MAFSRVSTGDEGAGQSLGLLQGVHRGEDQGHLALLTVLPELLQALADVGALGAEIDGQVLLLDGPPFGAGSKPGDRAAKGQRQQLIAAVRGVHRLKAVGPGEALVGEPGLLLGRAQHADPGLPLRPGVRQAGLHQGAAVALALKAAGDPQAVQVEVVVPLHGDPGGFQRSILDEHRRLDVQLPEHVALPEPLRQPPALGLHPRMGLPAADDAAQVLQREIFLRQVDELGLHRPPPV